MTYQNIIQESIHYIDQHINDDLTSVDVADHAGFSIAYFHRLFTAHTGLGLMCYVRQRKMAYARLDVIHGLRILDIALSYGYGSERAFTRAFQSTFGITPSACRQLPYVLPPTMHIHRLQLSGEKGVYHMNFISDVTYQELKEMTVVSKRRISNNPEEEVIAEMNAYIKEHRLPSDTDCYGFDVPVPQKEADQGIRGYEYWAKVEDGYSDKSVEVRKIPGYRYVSLTITDPFADPFQRIPDGWKTLVAWMEENRIESTTPHNAACLEHVYEADGRTYMRIMIPVNPI